MFGLTEWRQTRFYQEVQEETQLKTKLEAIPRMLEEGISVEQIARILQLDIETVQQVMKTQSRKES
jgi:predicted transposase YdaD